MHKIVGCVKNYPHSPPPPVFFANSAMILLLQRKRARKAQARTQVIEAATKPNGNLMLY